MQFTKTCGAKWQMVLELKKSTNKCKLHVRKLARVERSFRTSTHLPTLLIGCRMTCQ